MLDEIIKNYLINNAMVVPAKFDCPDLRVSDMGLDSLGLVEMLFEVEDMYGLQIPDPMRYQTMSFAEMVDNIEAIVRAHPNGKTPPIDEAMGSE